MCGAFALLTQASWLSGPTLWPLLASALLLTSCTWSLQEVRNSLCVDFFTSLSLKSSSRHFNHHRQLFLAQTGVLAPLCSANKSCPCIGGFLHPILTTVAASHKRAVRHLTLASSVKALEGLGTRTFRRFPSLLRLVNPASRPPPPPPSCLPFLTFQHCALPLEEEMEWKYPLQYSCLENPMDREAWRATVHGVAQSRTQLSTQRHALPLLPAGPSR